MKKYIRTLLVLFIGLTISLNNFANSNDTHKTPNKVFNEIGKKSKYFTVLEYGDTGLVGTMYIKKEDINTFKVELFDRAKKPIFKIHFYSKNNTYIVRQCDTNILNNATIEKITNNLSSVFTSFEPQKKVKKKDKEGKIKYKFSTREKWFYDCDKNNNITKITRKKCFSTKATIEINWVKNSSPNEIVVKSQKKDFYLRISNMN